MTKVMPEPDLPDLPGAQRLRLWPERWRWRVSLVLALIIALAAGLAWFNREQIAGNLINDTLAQNGLEATYEIESIGTRRQIITDLVIGDPAKPDFTAERVSLDISYTYGPPEIGLIELEGARAFGSIKDGTVSFGSLDPLLFAESEEPAGLPAINLKIVDGRARIDSDFGIIGAKLDGIGRLDDGFVGKIAATAPGLGMDGCQASTSTLYGDLTSADGRLSFDGPLRLREVDCEGARVASADIGAEFTLSRDFAAVESDLALSAADLAGSGITLAGLGGSADVAWRFDGELSVRHDLTGEGLASEFGDASKIGAEGTLRSRDGFVRNEWTSRLSGDGIDIRNLAGAAGFASARKASAGTFASPLIGKVEDAIALALAGGGAFAGDVSMRTDKDSVRLMIPEARLSSASGETLLALSRIAYASVAEGQSERLSGNILTGGAGLPRINARFTQGSGGATNMRMTMAEFREGRDAVSIPRLDLRMSASGSLRFTGLVQAEGAIPGGEVRGLFVPVEGRWSQASGVSLGSRCLDAKISSLKAYDFALGAQSLSLCPVGGAPLVRYDNSLKIAGKLADVALSGQYGDEPATVAFRGATLRYPGGFAVDAVEASLGQGEEALRFTAANIDGTLSDGLGDGLAGSFSGATADLGAVPVDVSDISGRWSYSEDALRISDGAFLLAESLDPSSDGLARFEPIRGSNASLELIDGVVRAQTGLDHPGTGRNLANVTATHDLASAQGRADFTVAGIRFDDGLQPDDLTSLTRGLIAFADGVIEGRGQFAWQEEELTSSGNFSTDGFDFAAAFGPVRGVKGEIEFTDLLNMTTAPSQVATIASVNPGVEALGGKVVYSITNGTIINLEDGRWPFMGGDLILRPVTLDYGGGQGQSYIFELVGLDAATFVSQMELTNLGARGRFDGTIPIIFDEQGNGTIQGGLLISRPPGGNVSYVGELTYEDLGTISNYAFQTLRSLDYNQMSIELNGDLAGEILTNFNIDGVRQGEGTSQNFITRQLAQLPIRFKINVRSENFYLLSQVVQGFFDPTIFDRDDIRETLGIGALAPIGDPEDPTQDFTPTNEAQRRDEPAVQPSESEDPL